MTETAPIPGNNSNENTLEPIDSVLLRLAKESYLLHAELAQLEKEISDTVITTNAEGLIGMQRIDSARQAMEGLSRFLSRLAVTVDTAGNCDPVEASRTLTLQAQARRLAGAFITLPPPPEQEPEVW